MPGAQRVLQRREAPTAQTQRGQGSSYGIIPSTSDCRRHHSYPMVGCFAGSQHTPPLQGRRRSRAPRSCNSISGSSWARPRRPITCLGWSAKYLIERTQERPAAELAEGLLAHRLPPGVPALGEGLLDAVGQLVHARVLSELLCVKGPVANHVTHPNVEDPEIPLPLGRAPQVSSTMAPMVSRACPAQHGHAR